GPVSAVMSAADDDVAVALANATRFGLGAAIITGDDERGEAVAAQIDAGMVFVNQLVKSDPRLPFGGVKDSGYGRELSQEGAVAFLNTKLVWVD
ncbi:MAG: aldehyde dehydrogenase family protein, partial [Actinomycetota bacterium]